MILKKVLKALTQIIKFKQPVIKEFPDRKMKCAVVDIDGVAIEFLQDDSKGGFLGRFRRKNGNSIHHFCLVPDNIEKDAAALKKKGVKMMWPEPATGLRGKKVIMTDPDAFSRITIELSEI